MLSLPVETEILYTFVADILTPSLVFVQSAHHIALLYPSIIGQLISIVSYELGSIVINELL